MPDVLGMLDAEELDRDLAFLGKVSRALAMGLEAMAIVTIDVNQCDMIFVQSSVCIIWVVGHHASTELLW